jgi:hypothetical protein
LPLLSQKAVSSGFHSAIQVFRRPIDVLLSIPAAPVGCVGARFRDRLRKPCAIAYVLKYQ